MINVCRQKLLRKSKHTLYVHQFFFFCVWNVMAHAQKPHFVFRRNGRVHLNRRWASVQSPTGSRGVRISDCNAGYTMFRVSVKGTGYTLHSPVSPSLPLPCVTVCNHISTGLCIQWLRMIESQKMWYQVVLVKITKNLCVLYIQSNTIYISPSSTVGIQLHVSALYVGHLQVVI